jgi:hypothetical protein
MNTIAIEPADITLKYNRGEITNTSTITFNGSHVGYVGYCYTTNEWLAFTPTGDDIGEFADNRDGAIELLDIDLDSCEVAELMSS